jgi:hypothetical protein
MRCNRVDIANTFLRPTEKWRHHAQGLAQVASQLLRELLEAELG